MVILSHANVAACQLCRMLFLPHANLNPTTVYTFLQRTILAACHSCRMSFFSHAILAVCHSCRMSLSRTPAPPTSFATRPETASSQAPGPSARRGSSVHLCWAPSRRTMSWSTNNCAQTTVSSKSGPAPPRAKVGSANSSSTSTSPAPASCTMLLQPVNSHWSRTHDGHLSVVQTNVLYIASYPRREPLQVFRRAKAISYFMRGEFITYFDATDRAGNKAEQLPFGVIMYVRLYSLLINRAILAAWHSVSCQCCRVAFLPRGILAACHFCRMPILPRAILDVCHSCRMSMLPHTNLSACHSWRMTFLPHASPAACQPVACQSVCPQQQVMVQQFSGVNNLLFYVSPPICLYFIIICLYFIIIPQIYKQQKNGIHVYTRSWDNPEPRPPLGSWIRPRSDVGCAPLPVVPHGDL